MREVRWEPSALAALRSLPREIARRIGRSVDRYAASGHGDVRKLVGGHGRYRLRVGDYRVIFTFEDGQLVIVVLDVKHRRETYRS